jgi:hypothetical protein
MHAVLLRLPFLILRFPFHDPPRQLGLRFGFDVEAEAGAAVERVGQ